MSAEIIARIAMRIPSKPNRREHFQAVAKREKAQRKAVFAAMAKYADSDAFAHFVKGAHGLCTITQVQPRLFDCDNLVASHKAIRDSIADIFCEGDDSPGGPFVWRSAQTLAEGGTPHVLIKIERISLRRWNRLRRAAR